MGEVSTRVWIDDALWEELRQRALADKTTVRELIPQLLQQGIGHTQAAHPGADEAKAALPTPGVVSPGAEPGAETEVPVVELSDVYRCAVCGAQVKLGGLVIHMGKHLKERKAAEEERS